MKTKTLFAVALVALVAAFVPALSSADAGSAVQADLTQLSSDITAAHDALIADFGAITTAAQAGDKTALRTAIGELRSDRQSLLPAVQNDRKQLLVDLKAARAANVTGLRDTVKAAIAANRAQIREIRQARHDARAAIRALRHATS
jgi:hypothetical protein